MRGARGLERSRDYAGPTSILPEPTADRLRPSRVSICARGAPRAERPRGRAFRRGGGSGDRRCEACVGSHGLLAVRDRSWEHSCGWEWPWHLAYPSTRRAALPPIRSSLAGRAIKICAPDRCRQRPESRCHELKTVQKVLDSIALQVLQRDRGLNRTFMMGENLGSDPLGTAVELIVLTH